MQTRARRVRSSRALDARPARAAVGRTPRATRVVGRRDAWRRPGCGWDAVGRQRVTECVAAAGRDPKDARRLRAPDEVRVVDEVHEHRERGRVLVGRSVLEDDPVADRRARRPPRADREPGLLDRDAGGHDGTHDRQRACDGAGAAAGRAHLRGAGIGICGNAPFPRRPPACRALRAKAGLAEPLRSSIAGRSDAVLARARDSMGGRPRAKPRSAGAWRERGQGGACDADIQRVELCPACV